MSEAAITGLVLLFGLLVGILGSVPIAVTIGIVTFLALALIIGPEKAALLAAQRSFVGVNSFALLAIPFFILAGSLMNTGGIARRLVDAALVLVGRMPGALAQTNVVANAMFGSVSGAAVAAAAAVGGTVGPRMRKDGYDPAFVAAVNTASAPSGMLIPPSNTLIVYSLVSSTSVAALFMAGYIPGLLWMATCMIAVGLYAARQKNIARQPRLPLGQSVKVVLDAVPSLFMIVVVIGGIIIGWFTATESAAIAVVYCLVLGFLYRELKVKDLPSILLDSAKTTAIVMLLIAVSSSMSWVMSYSDIPTLLMNGISAMTETKWIVLLLITLIMLIVGTFMDPTPAILIFVPIFLPIVQAYDISPIHFGMIMTFNLCLGTLTPPVGNVLFVGARIGNQTIEQVTPRLVPFFVALAAALLMVVYIPALSTWLPSIMGLM